MDEENIYNSGLNRADWETLRSIIAPYGYGSPREVSNELDAVPPHLKDHSIIRLLQLYRQSGDEKYLQQAGRQLAPDAEDAWHLAVTKG